MTASLGRLFEDGWLGDWELIEHHCPADATIFYTIICKHCDWSYHSANQVGDYGRRTGTVTNSPATVIHEYVMHTIDNHPREQATPKMRLVTTDELGFTRHCNGCS